MERKISEYKIDEENKRMLQDAINRVMYMKDKQVPIELIDEMTKVKADFKVLSKDIIENMLKDMSEDEKAVLLRLYIYESK